jgi:aminoglycoside phosphotransferase
MDSPAGGRGTGDRRGAARPARRAAGGRLGVSDRWADLAIATWSLDWNYGHGWGPDLLAAYGVADDPRRRRYYRLLWDLAP